MKKTTTSFRFKEWAWDITKSLVITTIVWTAVNVLGVERSLWIVVEILKHMNDQ